MSEETYSVDERVLVRTGITRFQYSIHIVKAVGKGRGGVTLEDGTRFTASGTMYGVRRNDVKLMKLTPELEPLAVRQGRVAFLKLLAWDEVPDVLLAEVLDVLRRWPQVQRYGGVPE